MTARSVLRAADVDYEGQLLSYQSNAKQADSMPIGASGIAVRKDSAPVRNAPHRMRLAARVLAVVVVLGMTVWFFRHPLMAGAARAWIVDDVMEKADAVVVLGGGAEWRPFAAAAMYRRGLTPLVLVANVKPSRSAKMKLREGDTDLTLKILKMEGVPDSAIHRFGDQVANSHEEAVALHAWVKAQPAVRTIAIPTDPFPTRRTKYFFTREFADTGVKVDVHVVPSPDYDSGSWWSSEAGLISFQNEVVKFIYYLIRY